MSSLPSASLATLVLAFALALCACGGTPAVAPPASTAATTPPPGEPESDRDEDAIPDACDLCPDEAEVVNRWVDQDGCPDAWPVVLQIAPIRILERVQFSLHRARLTAEHAPILDAIASVIQANPQLLRIEVRAYPEDLATGLAQLATRRITLVVDALVQRGVERSRLVPMPPTQGLAVVLAEESGYVGFTVVDPPETEPPPPTPPDEDPWQVRCGRAQ